MFRFTPAHPGDEHTIGHLRQQCWAATYRGIYPDDMIDHFDYVWHAERDLARIASDRYEVYLIEDGNQPVGYMNIEHGTPPLLYSLYLLPSHQRRGIGKAAFAHMRQLCQTQGQPFFLCHCQPENSAAIAFYHRMGGVIIHRDAGNEDAFMNSVTFRFDV